MARLDPSRRLGRLAALLKAPKPFYVRQPVPPTLAREFPNEGWYWTTASGPEYLGRDAYTVHHRLMTLLEELEQQAQEEQ